MKSRSKGLYIASAPILLLVLFAMSMRLTHPAADADTTPDPVDTPAGGMERRMILVDPVTQAQLEKVVSAMLEAIGKKDYKKALDYSAASFRKRVSPEDFESMMTARYPALIGAQARTYGQANSMPNQVILPTICTGVDGQKTTFFHALRREEGNWVVIDCVQEPPVNHPLQSTPPVVSGVTKS